MSQLHLRLPIPPLLERAPELAALAILEAALLASYAELYNGALDGIPRATRVLRANAIIIHARRLAAALAAYRDALEREALRDERVRNRTPF